MKKIVLPLVLILVLLSNTIAFAAGSLNLPSYPVNVTYGQWGQGFGSTFNSTLSGVGAGFDVADGTYAGWCIQKGVTLDSNQVSLYSSDDSAMPADALSLPWNKINYLLNHKAGTVFEVQDALWVLLGQLNIGSVSPAAAAMVQDAETNGGSFVPAAGQIIAVLLYSDGINTPNDQFQETIIEVQIPGRHENPGTGTPGYWKNHPEAWPVDSITIGEDTYTKSQAITLMGTPENGDKTFTVFRDYVAAFLNVQIGNDSSCITNELTAAYNWLDVHEPGSGVAAKSAAWKAIQSSATTLDNYNNGLLCAPHRD